MLSDLTRALVTLGVVTGMAGIYQIADSGWQSILLVIVAIVLLVVVILVGWRLWSEQHAIRADQALAAADQKMSLDFLAALRKEVGTDHGSSLASRLLSQDEALEAARLLAERRAIEYAAQSVESHKISKGLTESIEALRTIVEKMRTEQAWQKEVNTLRTEMARVQAEALAKGITLSVMQAGQSAQGNTTTDVARDMVGRDAAHAGDDVIRTGDDVKIDKVQK